jgi:hypothetical protein
MNQDCPHIRPRLLHNSITQPPPPPSLSLLSKSCSLARGGHHFQSLSLQPSALQAPPNSPPLVLSDQQEGEGHKNQIHQEQQHIVHGPAHISRSNHAILVLGSEDKRTGARAYLPRWIILIQQSLSHRLLMRAGVG